jgi:hypothetical protein
MYYHTDRLGSPIAITDCHGSSWSFMTRAAAESLMSYRRTGSLRGEKTVVEITCHI